ncbi:MAG: flagellar hook assembly protein FlgD [Rhodanobacteraceae bacterium]
MSTVTPTTASAPFTDLQSTAPTAGASQNDANSQSSDPLGLSSQDFMQMLLAQVTNQSPLDPTDPSEFLSQMAELSTVSGINQLDTDVNSLGSSLSSSQALQAAKLVGSQAEAPSGTVQWDGKNNVTGGVVVPTAAQDVTVTVTAPDGTVVDTLALGSQQAGTAAFTWNGTDANGQSVPPGTYDISATAASSGGTTTLQTLATGTIQGVSLGGSQGLMLNINGLGSVPFSQIQQIL